MKNEKTLYKNVLAVALMGVILMSSLAFLSSVSESGSLSEFDDSGMDSPSDLNDEFDDDVNDVGEIKTRLSDGTFVEVELDVPMSAVTVESKNMAVQRAREVSDGSIDRIEVAIEDGRIVWNVRLLTSDGNRVDIRIDDATKTLVRSRIVSEHGESDSIQTLDLPDDRSGSNSNNEDDENSDSLESSGNGGSENSGKDDFFLVKIWKSIVSLFKS